MVIYVSLSLIVINCIFFCKSKCYLLLFYLSYIFWYSNSLFIYDYISVCTLCTYIFLHSLCLLNL